MKGEASGRHVGDELAAYWSSSEAGRVWKASRGRGERVLRQCSKAARAVVGSHHWPLESELGQIIRRRS